MKYLTLLVLLCSTAVLGAPLKGVITVQLENGAVKRYSAEQYMVIKRPDPTKLAVHRHKPRKPHIKKEVTPVVNACVTPAPPPQPIAGPTNHKNRVRLMGGLGPVGVTVNGGPQTYSVSPSEQLVGGIGYSRVLTGRWSADAQALTNSTYTLGIGFDF